MILDEQQTLVVNAKEPKIICIASAGSGKTRVLTERIKRLVEEGVDAGNIVAITYTNAAAEEMRERLPDYKKGCFIGTVHSYANSILMSRGIDTSNLIANNKFNDLFTLFKTEIKVMPHIEHLLVDEFQDSSRVQYEFFETLHAKNYFFVMDDYQAIFDFDPDNPGDASIGIDLSNSFEWKTYFLKNNYRSGINIIRFANGFINKIRDKVFKVVKPCAEYPGIVYEQGKFDIFEVVNILRNEKDYKNWMILASTNIEVETIMNALKKSGIPCFTFKKANLKNGEIKELMSKDEVKVLTIHSAKGLEADNVIVKGFSIMKFGPSQADHNCRMLYVAITRARKKVIWYK